MRFLILNMDYGEFIHWLYAQYPGLEKAPYEEQLQARMKSLFAFGDFYSSNLRQLGHEAWEVYGNNELMQKAWAREHGLPVDETTSMKQRVWTLRSEVGRIVAKTPIWRLRALWRPLLGFSNGRPPWFYEILASQIKAFKPDIVLNQSMDGIGSRFLRGMRPFTKLLVGRTATPFPENEDFSGYDLVLSALPSYVDHFRSKGMAAEFQPFAFEPRVLTTLKGSDQNIPVSFVGSVFLHHIARVQLLEHLCARQPVKIWGGEKGLPGDSAIRRSHMGQAWGREMYEVLRRSKITLNQHGEIAGPYAANMRLFEATGVGAMLLTDWKSNLKDLFEPAKEVVAYRTHEECMELISYYLDHDVEREFIARAGQQRTLRDHTYYQRMTELVEIIRRYI